MGEEIGNAIHAADTEAQYDEKAKRLLGNKIILAYILVNTMDEFRGMKPQDVASYIEGEPFIGIVPVEPGLTNSGGKTDSGSVKEGPRIVGLNTENAEINEGLIRFDIIFYVRMKDGISQVIVNLEAQKDEPTSYYILDRAVFYVSRLVSSQKERDFVKTNCSDIKRVFSIWVCMNMDENCMDYIHLTNDNRLGSYQWRGRLDLLNIVLIGIANEIPENDEKYELHRLLGTLLSMELSAVEKLGIIETEYRIPIDDRMREDVRVMCNLSQGILERGEAIGEARGEAIGEARGKAIGEARGEAIGEARIIRSLYKNGYTVEQIASASDKTIEEVEAVVGRSETEGLQADSI